MKNLEIKRVQPYSHNNNKPGELLTVSLQLTYSNSTKLTKHQLFHVTFIKRSKNSISHSSRNYRGGTITSSGDIECKTKTCPYKFVYLHEMRTLRIDVFTLFTNEFEFVSELNFVPAPSIQRIMCLYIGFALLYPFGMIGCDSDFCSLALR